jgi:hypothetical protein
MPVVKSKEDVKSLLSTKRGGSKPVIFGEEINKLKSGEGLFFSAEEWTIKTTPSAYFYAHFRKGKDVKIISVSKVENGYLITKL